MKLLKKIMWLLLLAFIVIQFFRPEKNISATASSNNISQKFSLPDDVKQILSTSCYDCHSNNTRYPWYFSVQPLAWWMGDHIQHGKRVLNFDEYVNYPLRKQFKRFGDIREMIEENEMPLSSYTIIHRDAILSEVQKERIIAWSNLCIATMKATFPLDSLIKK